MAQPSSVSSVPETASQVNLHAVSVWNPAINSSVIASMRNADPQAIEAMRAKSEKLLRDERAIAAGPVERNGKVYIPSPSWRPEAVREWKAKGGEFRKLNRLFDVWVVDARRMPVERAREIYFNYFFSEVAVSKNNLRMAGV